MPMHTASSPMRSRCVRCLLLSSGLLFSAWFAVSLAQVPTTITPDGTLGTTVTPHGRVHTIEGGAIRGRNLFHSFDRFDVGTGDTASFTGPKSLANILSRVTGGQPSNIDGILQSKIPGANLYLLNPSGVVFGPNATLDVSGSFHVSTADYLRFANGATFAAHLGAQSTLTVAPPAAFGFLQENPAAIRIHGSHLFVPQGETLSVVSEDIEIAGDFFSFFGIPTLGAPSGQVSLVSVASPGEVVLHVPGGPSTLNVESFERLGEVTLSDFALINVSGDGGGTVTIRGSHLIIDSANIFADAAGDIQSAPTGIDVQIAEDIVLTNGAQVTTDVFSRGDAGAIQVSAASVAISNEAVLGSRAFRDSSGNAGNIDITARSMQMTRGGRVASETFSGSRGNAGNVTLQEVDTLVLRDAARISGTTEGRGRGGKLTITAHARIDIAGGSLDNPTGLISNSSGTQPGDGDGGALVITAPLLRMDGGRILARTLGEGDAGDITIQVGRLDVTGGAQIFNGVGNASQSPPGTGGPGRGGNLTVIAADSIFIAGSGQGFESFLGSTAQFGPGRAGDLLIRTPRLEMRGGVIGASTLRDSRGKAGALTLEVGQVWLSDGATITSGTEGEGQGGALTVRGLGGVGTAADLVSIVGAESGLSTNAAGEGQGGNIVIEARDLQLSEGAAISAESSGTGNAGRLTIMATDTFLSTNSAVTTAADTAGGGNIALEARFVRLTDSVLTAEARGVDQQGSDGGNVTIRAGFVILDSSMIQANAFGGNGGNIVIEAEEAFLADTETCADQGCLDASSQLGVAGTVAVSTPTADLSGVVTPLPQTFTQATALLPQRCAERLQGRPVSTFVLAGRGSVPLQPGGMLPSPLAGEGNRGAQPIVPRRTAKEKTGPDPEGCW